MARPVAFATAISMRDSTVALDEIPCKRTSTFVVSERELENAGLFLIILGGAVNQPVNQIYANVDRSSEASIGKNAIDVRAVFGGSEHLYKPLVRRGVDH